jgi:type VI secretion system protein ImpM
MTSFLAAAEEAGRDALEHDLTPADLVQRIQASFTAAEGPAPELAFAAGHTAWWTEGGPRVVARFETGTALPEGGDFAALIDDDWGANAAVPAVLVPRASDPRDV